MRRRAIVISLVLVIVFIVGCKRKDEEIIPGLSWSMSPANPVLEPSTEPSSDLCGWYNDDIWFPWVIDDGPVYKMWFTGTNTENEDRIGYATSPNGLDWSIYENAVFEAALAPGSWDSGGVWNHCVIKDGADYKMFYTGYEFATGSDDKIGLAYSSDGLAWTREIANPVIAAGPPGSWYEKAVYSGTVLTSGATYMMWFSGVASDGTIRTGYTSSTDCLAWSSPVMVLDAGPEDYDASVAFLPSVVFDSKTFHMWYTGFGPNGYAFCYATSTDGISWGKHGVARRDSFPAIWEDGNFVSGCVLLDIATFRMWYSARCSADNKARIGYATSPAPAVP